MHYTIYLTVGLLPRNEGSPLEEEDAVRLRLKPVKPVDGLQASPDQSLNVGFLA